MTIGARVYSVEIYLHWIIKTTEAVNLAIRMGYSVQMIMDLVHLF